MILSCQKIKHSSAFHKSVEHTGKMWTVSITSKKKKGSNYPEDRDFTFFMGASSRSSLIDDVIP